ncbi:MAG: hypothetical protein IJ418_18975 [Clostridia bacterium]|nr:hypothetical protein [Clostridia bacterium]
MERMKQLLQGLDPTLMQKAQQYLNSGKVISIKHFSDEIEGMMQEKDAFFMPYYRLDDDAFGCQCQQGEGMCIRKAALLLAAQVMVEADHPDYHMAVRILTARKLENALRQK